MDSATSLQSENSDLDEVPAIKAPKDPNFRFKHFPDVYEFVKGGVGSKRAVPSRGIRNSSWKILFQLAKTPKELEQVVELLPKWREMHRSFDMKDSEIFTRAYFASQHPSPCFLNHVI